MAIKISYTLARSVEGALHEVLAPVLPPPLHLQDVCAVIRNLSFIVEHAGSGSETARRTLADAQTILTALEG